MVRDQILQDVYFLQMIASTSEFETTINLFMKKHALEIEFIEYFENDQKS